MQFKLKLSSIASFYLLKQRWQNKTKETNIDTDTYNQSNPIQNGFESKRRTKVNPINKRIIIKRNNQNINDFNEVCFNNLQRNHINNNNETIKSVPIKHSDKISSHRTHSTLEQFYSTQAKYLNDRKDKLYALRLEKQKKMETLLTFHPIINHNHHHPHPNYHTLHRTHSLTIDSKNKIPRYIKLNQDAITHKHRIVQLQSKLIEEEKQELEKKKSSHSSKTNFGASDIPSAFYHEKLYQDAYNYNRKKIESQKKFYSDMTFMPNNELSQSFNSKFEINTTFDERNQRSIEAKRRNQLLNGIEEKELELKKRRDRLPKEKIEENNRSVIERLYIKHFEKAKQKKKYKAKQTEKNKAKDSKSIEKSISLSINDNKKHKYNNTISIISSDNTTLLLSHKLENSNDTDALIKGEYNIKSDPSFFNSKLLNDNLTSSDPK